VERRRIGRRRRSARSPLGGVGGQVAGDAEGDQVGVGVLPASVNGQDVVNVEEGSAILSTASTGVAITETNACTLGRL